MIEPTRSRAAGHADIGGWFAPSFDRGVNVDKPLRSTRLADRGDLDAGRFSKLGIDKLGQ